MRAASPVLPLFLGLSACAAPIDLPTTCDEAFERVEPGQRGATLERAGAVEVGESLPVFRYRSDRSLAMTYGRSVALGCVLLDDEPQPNELLRRAIGDALDGQPVTDAAFDASQMATVSVDASDAIVRIEVSDPSRASEVDFDTLEPGIEDEGIGDAAAESIARETLSELVDSGLLNDADLELVQTSRSVGSFGETSFVTEFQFVFGYMPGGIRALGPECSITVDREGVVLSLSLAEADLTVARDAVVEVSEAQANALLEAHDGQVETFYEAVGPAWFAPSPQTGDAATQQLRYYGKTSRGLRWISMMSPDDGVEQIP